MTEFKNILPQDNLLKNEQLLNYVENSLSDIERHEVEMQMANDNFDYDAVEGLEQFNDTTSIKDYVHHLNEQLIRQTTKKRIRKHKRKLRIQDWILISIGIILVLCIMGYYIVKQLES